MKRMSWRIAGNMVDGIILDLTSRSGLENEWENIDEDIQDEIRSKWIDIIVREWELDREVRE